MNNDGFKRPCKVHHELISTGNRNIEEKIGERWKKVTLKHLVLVYTKIPPTIHEAKQHDEGSTIDN